MIQNDLSFCLIWSGDQTAGDASSRVVISFAALCRRPFDMVKCAQPLGTTRRCSVFWHAKFSNTCCQVKTSSCRWNIPHEHAPNNAPVHGYTGFYRSTETHRKVERGLEGWKPYRLWSFPPRGGALTETGSGCQRRPALSRIYFYKENVLLLLLKINF